MTRGEKIKHKILRKYPNAKLLVDSEKNLYIEINGINLMEQNLLPPTDNPDRAWIQADISMRITQNINRTHPLRTQSYSSIETNKRINKRRTKNKKKFVEYSLGYDYDQC